ncbi:MAG: hypothetical protein ACU0DM_05655 [Paracoccus sp. (in: a-proteobacteria)]
MPLDATRPSPEALNTALARLEAQFGSRFSRALPVRQQHACTVTWHEN